MKIRNFLLITLIITLSYFFINHQNDEVIIDEKFQEALKFWDLGEQKKALNTLDEILIKYKKNDLTKKIYLKKLDFENIYFSRFNPYHIKKDIFSAVIQNNINEYFKKSNTYPDDLKSLNLLSEIKDFINLCEYEKYDDTKGFYINCKNLENKYNETHNPNIEGLIPVNSFISYYSNNGTSNAVFSETTNQISLNSNGDFHNINANIFSGYWIGYIKVEENEERTISISQSRATTKIIIDDKEFFNSSNNKELTVNLNKGLHKIEVYHNNSWNSISLNILLNENKKNEIYDNNLINFFNKVKHINYEPVVVSINQSSREDNKIDLHLKKFSKPIVLFLYSYKAVKWNISNPENNKIFAIIYSSHNNSSIKGDIKNVLLIQSNIKLPSKIKQKASCVGLSFNISGSNIFNIQKIIYEITSKNLTNFTGDYQGNEFIVPMFIVDENLINETKENLNYIQNELEKCKQINKNTKLLIHKG
jgi:hypothetical protein